MNWKRRRSRRKVRCQLCTPGRYGNARSKRDGRFKAGTRRKLASGLE